MTVAEIQRALIARGYDLGTGGPSGKGDDDDAGEKTIAALKAFQQSIGLPGYGVPGETTLAALLEPIPAVEKRATGPEPRWLTLACAELGVKEGAGAANNPRVVKLFADAGFPGIKQDSVAWCAAAVGAMLKRSGIEPSGSLAARSYEGWGVSLKEPVLGCVATKRRSGSFWQGHVGFVVGATEGDIILLGGNQGDAWSIAKFPRSAKGGEFTAFRWPSGVEIPVGTKLPNSVAGAKSGVSEA